MALVRISLARSRLERGGRVREMVFGLQDALLATIGLVAGVDSASQQDSRIVIFAGLAHMVAGAVSMGAGEYLSAAAQRRVTAAGARAAQQIVGPEEPYVAQEGVLAALEKKGLNRADAYRVVDMLSRSPSALGAVFRSTVLGLSGTEAESSQREAIAGALVMACSFAAGAILPVIPYFFWYGPTALVLSVAIAVVAIFAVGWAIGAFCDEPPLRSALQFSAIALGAGALGYAVGLAISAVSGERVPAG